MISGRVVPGAAALMLALCAVPATARVSPYVRLAFGGEQLRMSEGNALLRDTKKSFTDQGLPADINSVAFATGPSASAGLWLLRGFRVGATYSSGHSTNVNHVHVPGLLFYAEDLDFRLSELGLEAAVTFERWGGLTFGGHVAETRAKIVEGHTEQDFTGGGDLFMDATAEKTKRTYGAYMGFEERNEQNVVGFLRAGYQFRDMGTMPSALVISDGFTTVQAAGTTIGLDYSGFYVKAGVGYDFGR